MPKPRVRGGDALEELAELELAEAISDMARSFRIDRQEFLDYESVKDYDTGRVVRLPLWKEDA